jgi:hypothetical protein
MSVHVLKIAEECNEAAGRAASLAVECFNQHVLQSDIKVRTVVKTFIRICRIRHTESEIIFKFKN